MRLESIELVGFKSFAHQTIIKLPAGLTEIVGPNGSGKSNVIEAIRWALGEQSAKNLRSNKMTDVIFSGSRSHRALDRAKVALTFDNRDHLIDSKYDELRVARKLYRNGQSFYYLNNKPCRLRDVQELFMNSGIGNGSFSIISQGKVQKIFKSKPEDRRFIVETAAGIYKYKTQKHAAMNRLDDTSNNLVRVNDLATELGRRLTNLGQERDKAKQYLAQRHSVRQLTIQNLFLKAGLLDHRQHLYQHQLLANRQTVKQINQRNQGFKQRIGRFQHRLDRLAFRRNQQQQQLLANSHQVDRLNGRRQLVQQRLTFQQRQVKSANVAIKKLKKKQGQLRVKITSENNRVQQANQRINHFKKSEQGLADQSLGHRINDLRARKEKYRSDYVRLVQRLTQVNGEVKNYHHYRSAIQNRITEIDGRLNRDKAQSNKLNRETSRLTKLLAKLSSRIKSNQHQFRAKQSKINQIHLKLKKFSQLQNRQLQQLQAIRAQLNGLKRIQANHTNLHRGERNLMNVAHRINGILGLVANYLRVPSEYVRAIETTLRSQLQQVIVTDSQVARSAINYLTRNRLGRVTLLPLNDLRERYVNSNDLARCKILPGWVGVAADLVQMPEQMTVVRKHLLGNVLIAKDLSSAIRISQKIHHRYRVVTLNGEVINAGGAITGGKNRFDYHGLLSQKHKRIYLGRRVRTLRQQLGRSRPKVSQLQNQLEDLSSSCGQQRHQLSRDVQQQTIKAGLRSQLVDELKRNRFDVHSLRSSLGQIKQNQRRTSLQQLLHRRMNLSQRLSKNQSVTRKIDQRLQQLLSRFQVVQHRHQKRRETWIKTTGALRQFQMTLKLTRDEFSRNNRNLEHLSEKADNGQRQIDSILKNRPDQKSLGKYRGLVRQIKRRQQSFRHQNDQLTSKLNRVRHQLVSGQERLVKARNLVNQGLVNRRAVLNRLNRIKQQLFEKYQVKLTTQKLKVTSLSVRNRLNHQLKQAHSKLNRIGPVNVNSIHECQQVNHRYQFLKRQLNDLNDSKHQLLATMNQMNSKIKLRFQKTFQQINRAFQTTYADIFKGGRAKLKLTDPQHLLTTGIDIMAQPPGKRYRNMELLSGGERSLTAIALLFAVLKIKPVPFCILDEAESALDAINVNRFAQYMERLKRTTQFIVITHRKETMLYADTLYGITMQHSGISRVISVNLKQAKGRD